MIAVSRAADRLGRRGSECDGLTQCGGNEAQEEGGICSGFHVGEYYEMLTPGLM